MTNFSFLEGASHAPRAVGRLGRPGPARIGIADRNSLAGRCPHADRPQTTNLPFHVGCRLTFTDETELIVYPRDRAAYGRLCRLLSEGKMNAPKGECPLTFEQAVRHGEGLVALAPARDTPVAELQARVARWAAAWPDELYLAAAPLHRGDDRARLNALAAWRSRPARPWSPPTPCASTTPTAARWRTCSPAFGRRSPSFKPGFGWKPTRNAA
jgi:error-prone DNA polymerase